MQGYNIITELCCTINKDGTPENNFYWNDASCTWQDGSALSGSTNWNTIMSLSDIYTPGEFNYEPPISSNYPAFKYAKEYGQNYTYSNYSSGWFIPSLYELISLYKNVDLVNSVISLLGDSVQQIDKAEEAGGGAYYYTSNQVNDNLTPEEVYILDMYDGYIMGYQKKETAYVRVIREL